MLKNIKISIDKFIDKRVTSKEESIRLLTFLLGMVAGIIGYPLHIIGVWGSGNTFLQSMSIAIEILLLAIGALYYFKRISLYHAFFSYGFMMVIMQSVKIVYLAYAMPANGTFLILFNSVICLLVVFLLASGYMDTIPFYLTGINFLAFVAIHFIRPNSIQNQFVVFFIFIELLDCILGKIAFHSIHQVETENKVYREEESDILNAFNMKREELVAYIFMSKKNEQTKKDITEFFDNLDERSERNIIKAVKLRETTVSMENADVTKAFPQLSPTEADVCRLVLHGKTINEISRLTGKTANNVSAVRNHIRKKLGLDSNQDLKDYLCSRLAG